MSFDLDTLRAAVAQHGRVARVVIGAIKGSSPREVGASMLVWESGQSGTIGGGALEYAAAQAARTTSLPYQVSHHALGPELGQCCGGAVSLVTELFDKSTLSELSTCGYLARGVVVRGRGTEPLAVTRALRAARAGSPLVAGLYDGWMVEPLTAPGHAVWIWGAGHVGRALVDVLSPLPDVTLTWIDDAPARFPEAVPSSVTCLPAADMPRAFPHAPSDAHHLILTYSHEIDLALCHAALAHGFRSCGVIGSATKWARFRNRLRALGHSEAQIARITCPIGDPGLGKHPHAIAIGVAQDLLKTQHRKGAEGQIDDRTASDA